MASQNIAAGRKRRADAPPPSRGPPKRRKPEIAVQKPTKGGEINVAEFVKAREFEIRAIEENVKAMKKTLSSRAFQQLPRHMRRRTASHNVKKVPKRLRRRATKEMRDDNTPTVSKRSRTPSRKMRLRLETAKSLQKANQQSKKVRQRRKDKVVTSKNSAPAKDQDPEKQVSIARIPKIKKNTLAKPPTATSKYKRRQVNKTWLPTHLWHAKRAHMTRPTEPLWRMAIPLRPTEKSYRPTHYASNSRGCVAWDTSYMSTVACRGTEHTLENMLGALRFGIDKHAGRLKRWKAGSRFAEGYVHAVEAGRLLGPALVLLAPVSTRASQNDGAAEKKAEGRNDASKPKREKVKLDRRLLIQVHPSIFHDFWTELLRAAKMQKPQVLVEDLRFEIGSIHVTGPASTESLLAVLHSRHEAEEGDAAVKTWKSMAGLSNPASLPLRAMWSLDIVDPRLKHSPAPLKGPSSQASIDRLNEMIAAWPLDENPPAMKLVSHKARWLASTNLPSQKALNRRKAAAGPGNAIPVIEKDPAIPVILLAHRAAGTAPNAQGSWTVLLPWCAVDAVWRSFQYYAISSGRTPRFGGLLQTQQIAFEQMTPWFPADMPGTEAGKAWERTESEKRFDKWIRRPPSRRLRWDMVDIGMGRLGELGRGWACDWEYLFGDTNVERKGEGQPPQDSAPVDSDVEMTEQPADRSRRRNTSSPETSPEPEERGKKSPGPEMDYYQLTPESAASVLDPRKPRNRVKTKLGDIPAIATVRIRLLTKGTPESGARVYRLPGLPSIPRTTSEMGPSSVSSARPQPAEHSSNPSPSLPPSAEVHTSTNPAATSSSPAPPGAQSPPPSTSFAFSSLPQNDTSPKTPKYLRDKWLSLVPPSFYTSTSNTKSTPFKAKSHPNPHHTHPLTTETHNLARINVFPPRASEELIAQFDTFPSDEQIAEFEAEQLLEELLKNDAVTFRKDGADGMGEVKWDASKGLVECPDKEDLVGFVTSGGFNLAEGRGTAVAGIWVQRMREGWEVEDAEVQKQRVGDVQNGGGVEEGAMDVDVPARNNARVGKKQREHRSRVPVVNDRKSQANQTAGAKTTPSMKTGADDGKTVKERRIKERTLCIIRNAGSGVGRLGWWEVCE